MATGYFLVPLGCALVAASVFRFSADTQAVAAVVSLAAAMAGAAAAARAWARRRAKENPDG